jgi:hypothetical protein
VYGGDDEDHHHRAVAHPRYVKQGDPTKQGEKNQGLVHLCDLGEQHRLGDRSEVGCDDGDPDYQIFLPLVGREVFRVGDVLSGGEVPVGQEYRRRFTATRACGVY